VNAPNKTSAHGLPRDGSRPLSIPPDFKLSDSVAILLRPERRVLQKAALAATVALVNSMLPGGNNAKADTPKPAPAPPPDEATTQLPEVIVTDTTGYDADALFLQKFPQPLLTTPRSAEVLTPALLQDQGVTSLRDALRNVSGVSINAGEGSYQGDNFSIRGFPARSDIYIDGMNDFGNYNRDPFNFEAIEVLKGPSSVEFGRGSAGGAVNMETKTPQLNAFTNISTMFGTDHTERGTIDFNEPISGLQGAAFRLNLMGDHANVTNRDNVTYERWGIAPSLAFGIGTPTRLTISYFHQQEDNIPDFGIPWYFDRPAPVAWNSFYGFASDYMKTNVNMGTIHFEHDFNDIFTLREQFRVADYGREYRVTEPEVPDGITPTTPLNSIQVARALIDGRGTDRLIDQDINLLAKFDTGPINHTVVTGFEFVHQGDDTGHVEPNWMNVPNTSLLFPKVNAPFQGSGTLGTSANAYVDTSSVYLKDTMKFSKEWSLSGGIRYDYISSDYNETIAPTSSLSENVGLFSWRAALVYQPQSDGSVYVSAGTAVHPNIAQIALLSETTILPSDFAGAAIAKNLEVEWGTKWNMLEKRFSFNSAVFCDWETNPAPEDLDNPLFVGTERVIGWEFSGVAHLTSKWQARLSYTYEYGKITASSDSANATVGLPVLNAPKNNASLWMTYDLPWNLQIGGGLNALSTRTGAYAPDPANGLVQQAPGYIVFSAMLKYRVSKNVDIQLNATNLTDRYYYDGVNPGHIIPGEGRTFFISTNFKF